MLAMAHAGLVFLSMTKSGSTAVEGHFASQAQMVVRKPPPMKHMKARTFEKHIAPVLRSYGFPRESYELMCIVRDPVDWAASWWRYRSRPAAKDKPVYTGDMSFDEFADRVITGRVRLGGAANFVSDDAGNVIVDRMYRYENLEQAAAWMAERLGIDPPTLKRANISPARPLEVSPRTRARLEEHFAADLEIYRSAR